ncbi:MAG TPA: hypothetical protein VG714_06695 [Acidobacteriaceae bacterium]|nr:hypothetical protein [Acidobacteriaceae bacterium]
MNKKSLLAFCLLATGAWYSSTALAARSSDSTAQPPDAASQSAAGDASTQPHTGWPTPEDTVARMSEKLNLTDDQKTKITPIIADRQDQIRALTADSSGRRLQKARKAKSILEKSDKKIEALLTSDQKKTYEQMKQQARDEVRSRMQQRDSGTPQQ